MKKIRFVSVFLILACILTFVACESSTVDEGVTSQEEEIKYAADEVVNKFIIDYNSFSNSPIVDIEKGNIRTKYYGTTYGYWIEMIHANDTDKIAVSIGKTNENANVGMDGMKEVFHDVIKAITPDLSDEDINDYFDNLIGNEYRVTEEAFHQFEVSFFPDREQNRGHIEIRSK